MAASSEKAEKFRVSNGVHSFSVSWDCWVAFQTWLDDNSIVNWKGVDGEAAINHIDISFMLSTRFAGLLECPSFVFFAVLLQSKSCLHICFTLTKASHCYRSPAVDMSVEGCANCMTNQLLRRLPPQPNAAHAIAHSQASKALDCTIVHICSGWSAMKYQWFELLTLLTTIPYHSSVSREDCESHVMLQDASSL